MARYVRQQLTKRSALIRIMRFGMVGASGACLNLILFSLLTLVFHVHYLIAGAVAIELPLCSNYLLNNAWTFADRSSGRATWRGLARYHAVAAGGTLINLGILHLSAGRLGMAPVAGNAVGMATAAAWNFALSIGWTWRRPRIGASAVGLQP